MLIRDTAHGLYNVTLWAVLVLGGVGWAACFIIGAACLGLLWLALCWLDRRRYE